MNSRAQWRFVKISFLTASRVFPIPCSSFSVGRIILIFRVYHTYRRTTLSEKEIKRVVEKNKKKEKKGGRGGFPLISGVGAV
jgi:hypothetical protein